MKKFLIGTILTLAAVAVSAQTVLMCTPVGATHNGNKVDHRQLKKLPVAIAPEYILTQREKFTKVPGSARSAASYGIVGGGETQTYLNLDNNDRVTVIVGNSTFTVAGIVFLGSENFNIIFDCNYQ